MSHDGDGGWGGVDSPNVEEFGCPLTSPFPKSGDLHPLDEGSFHVQVTVNLLLSQDWGHLPLNCYADCKEHSVKCHKVSCWVTAYFQMLNNPGSTQRRVTQYQKLWMPKLSIAGDPSRFQMLSHTAEVGGGVTQDTHKSGCHQTS